MPTAVTLSTFAGSPPPWNLASLDTNLAGLQTAIANANNYSNYLVDTGAANAYVVTFGVGLGVTLAAGLRVQFKATNANTGASTLNVSATGVKNILNPDGTALAPGQIPANAIVDVMYDGTQYLLLGLWQKGWQLLSTGTASSSATLDFTNLSGYKAYVFELELVIPANNGVDFLARISQDNGGTWIATGDYKYAKWRFSSAAGTAIAGSNASTSMPITDAGVSNTAAGGGVSGVVQVTGADNAGAAQKHFVMQTSWWDGVSYTTGVGNGVPVATGTFNGVRFLFGTGNIASGIIRCYGLRG